MKLIDAAIDNDWSPEETVISNFKERTLSEKSHRIQNVNGRKVVESGAMHWNVTHLNFWPNCNPTKYTNSIMDCQYHRYYAIWLIIGSQIGLSSSGTANETKLTCLILIIKES